MPSGPSAIPVSQIATLLAIGGASIALTHRPLVGSADRNVVVTSLTPNVAQGGLLVLDVDVHGPSSVLQSIEVEIPPHPSALAERRGPGSVHSVPGSYRVEVPVPEDAQASEVFVDVATVAGVRPDVVPHAHKTSVRVPVRVWTKPELRALEVALACMRALWLGVGAVAAATVVAAHRRASRSGATMSSSITRYGLLAGFSIGTFFVLGRPSASMLGYFGDAPALAISGVAVGLVIGASRMLAGRDRPVGLEGTLTPAAAGAVSYRTHTPTLDERGWPAIREALSAVPGLIVTHSNGAAEIARGGLRRFRPSYVALELLDQENEPAIGLRFNDSDLLFEVAKHVTGELGSVRLDLARDRAVFRYVVDRSTDVRAVVADFRREQRSHIELQESRAAFLDLLAKRAGLDD